jgi:protein required for attachment to host cells
MRNKLGSKLIAVLDINQLILFEAKGLKINKKIASFPIHSDTNHKTEKKEGFHGSSSCQSSFFDSHSEVKNIEYKESSKKAIFHIEEKLSADTKFSEIVLVSEAKMLGAMRSNLKNNLKKLVSKEVIKDLVNHSIAQIERAVFI